MSAARKALQLGGPNAPRQLWSPEKVIAEMRRLHRAGRRLSSSEMAQTGHQNLVIASYRYVGSWSRARMLADVSFKAKRQLRAPVWDEAAIIAEIKVRQKEGLSLAATKVPRSLALAGHRWFGSWREAITAAGIDYETILLLKTRSDAELVAWLRMVAGAEPQMTLNELDQHGEHAVVCRRRWGSLELAARAAGIVGWPKRERHRAMSRRSVIAELKRRTKRGTASIRSVRNSVNGHHLINSVFRYFAIWDDAVRAARQA
jgi:ribosome recycling factor